jgi:hypothetical protein
MLITPTTELEAVNECLENIGQAPVSTISGDLGVDTQIALNFVRKTNRQLQSQGWYWNTEEEYLLSPNGDGDILLPANTLSVRPAGRDVTRKLVQRGPRLYDRDNQRFTFTDDVYVDLTLGLAFEDLPETARRFIALRAARQFQDRVEGQATEGDTEDERLALSDLHADQLRVDRPNALTNNYSTASTLRRTAFGYTPNF